jgi:hypothetical protein
MSAKILSCHMGPDVKSLDLDYNRIGSRLPSEAVAFDHCTPGLDRISWPRKLHSRFAYPLSD